MEFGDEERQPVNRESAAQAEPANLPQHRIPDTRYPRSLEGILRIVEVVRILLAKHKVSTYVGPSEFQLLRFPFNSPLR